MSLILRNDSWLGNIKLNSNKYTSDKDNGIWNENVIFRCIKLKKRGIDYNSNQILQDEYTERLMLITIYHIKGSR